ncbi:hypothetical protein DYB34_006680 [Aphanomyces astaci]|uniref:Centrosomal protein of 70 kDa n=1 Tax=Aphanomyces astaci TaxID=112090 RepID=A0A3R6ZGS8_APHAT|nr:hypothetical protein DYB34_006680 [Aphanomyces astaci]
MYQLQNEALQEEVDRLTKSNQHGQRERPETPARGTTPAPGTVPATMRRDKLLRQLRCVHTPDEGAAPHIMLDVNGDMHELSNDLRQRAGLICMDMVADMCHRFDLSSLVDLPSHVKHVRRLSRSLPMLITFVERVEALTATGEVSPSSQRTAV